TGEQRLAQLGGEHPDADALHRAGRHVALGGDDDELCRATGGNQCVAHGTGLGRGEHAAAGTDPQGTILPSNIVAGNRCGFGAHAVPSFREAWSSVVTAGSSAADRSPERVGSVSEFRSLVGVATATTEPGRSSNSSRRASAYWSPPGVDASCLTRTVGAWRSLSTTRRTVRATSPRWPSSRSGSRDSRRISSPSTTSAAR